MAKSRGGDDGPKISMVVKKGTLVPLSQHDFELLDSWREGAIVNVSPTLASTRVTERRYFAMLGKLLKVASTPWTNTLAAHQSIKLATGFVEPYLKSNGEWASRERHISTFSDEELEEYFELFCGIVRRKFGVDPETLRKNAPDIGIHESSAPLGEPADDGPDADPIPVGVGEPSPSTKRPPATEDEPEAGGDLPVQPSARGSISAEDMAWLKAAARMMTCATVPGGGEIEVQMLDRQKRAIVRDFTPGSIGVEVRKTAMKIFRYCEAAVMEGTAFDKRWIANTAGCNVEDLRPEAR